MADLDMGILCFDIEKRYFHKYVYLIIRFCCDIVILYFLLRNQYKLSLFDDVKSMDRFKYP